MKTKKKSGVYRWTNNLNGNSYVGSAVNLYLRLKQYYALNLRKRIVIYNALLKYGYANFKLEILEYCDPGKCIEREQYYIDLLKPEYNVLKTAGSLLGFIHSKETRLKIASTMKGKKHSEEARAKMSDSQKAVNRSGKNHPMFGKVRPEKSGRLTQKIAVLDLLENKRTEYDSISAAALALGIKQTRISMYFINNQKKAYKGRYIFQKL